MKSSSNTEVENMPTEMTCREELLKAVRNVIKGKEINEFSIDEVIDYMKQNGTKFKESTVRTHIASRCCQNAPEHHGVVYEDYLRIGHGLYKLLNEKEGATQII